MNKGFLNNNSIGGSDKGTSGEEDINSILNNFTNTIKNMESSSAKAANVNVPTPDVHVMDVTPTSNLHATLQTPVVNVQEHNGAAIPSDHVTTGSVNGSEGRTND